jgi:gamma-glutamyltranspeptidase/glutathione hydrolase
MAKAASPERAAFIERIARRGSRGLTDDAVAGELMAVAGRPARGLLTIEDLSSVVPAVVPCHPEGRGGDGVVTVPWRLGAAANSSSTHVVAACDGNGLVSVACYEAPSDGLAIPALGVIAPPLAAPVLRGSPRVRPGDVRPAAAPIALRIRGGLVDLAFGIGVARAAEEALDEIVRSLRDAVVLRDALSARTGRLVAIARAKEARVLASE